MGEKNDNLFQAYYLAMKNTQEQQKKYIRATLNRLRVPSVEGEKKEPKEWKWEAEIRAIYDNEA